MSDKKKNNDVPLILNQNQNQKTSEKALRYQFGEDTYQHYANTKNPFLERVLTSDPASIDPEQTKALFQYLQGIQQYQVGFPTERSPHSKRKISIAHPPYSQKSEFVQPAKMKENIQILEASIQVFFKHTLRRLQDDQNELALIVNELVPLFIEHQIKIKIYDAFVTFYSVEQFLETLTKISQGYDLENFDFFCSALFGFYNQLQ